MCINNNNNNINDIIMTIGPVTEILIDKCIKELKRKKNKEKIMENIIDPLMKDIVSRYYPYFISIMSILIIIIILLISILILMILQKCENKL